MSKEMQSVFSLEGSARPGSGLSLGGGGVRKATTAPRHVANWLTEVASPTVAHVIAS